MTTVDNSKVSPSGENEDPEEEEQGSFNRPRAGSKTTWNWMNLLGILAILLVVVAATIGLGLLQLHIAEVQLQQDQQSANLQPVRDQQSALDQQVAILQAYIDNIQDLLLNHNLLGSKPTDDVAILARARTLTALQGLDPERKGLLVQFIYEARLIGFVDSTGKAHGQIIDLHNANLHNANLHNANLFGANLFGVNLISANLSGANLSDIDLTAADLSGANLSDADLIGANLLNANFIGTDLTGAHLLNATLTGDNLRGAQNLTQQELDSVFSCKNAILPPGLTCNRNK